MDLLCLIVGRVVVVAFGILGAVWLVTLPLDFAFRRLYVNKLFLEVWREHIQKNRSQIDKWKWW
jgi:hypothetical protein